MQLIPNRTFTVVRQIGNHTDSGTYYVRAVIRNAYTDVILDTLDLEDKGSLRFKKDWRVPAEPSGLGSFISIVTSVYTDSGYTTKSENYSDEEHTYLWAELSGTVGGGGFSEKFDYRRVESIVEKVVATIPAPLPFPEIPTPKEYEMKWDEVLSAVEGVKNAVAALPTENNDDTLLFEKLDEILGAIEAKEVTPVTDLSPVLERLSEQGDTEEVNHGEVKSLLDDMSKEVVEEVGKTVSYLFDQTSFVTSFATHVAKDGDMTARHKKMMQQNMKEANTEPEEEPEFDDESLINSLTK